MSTRLLVRSSSVTPSSISSLRIWLAQRRLAHVARLRRPPEMAMLGDRDEIANVLKVHAIDTSFISRSYTGERLPFFRNFYHSQANRHL
jgi:hypothetical protein